MFGNRYFAILASVAVLAVVVAIYMFSTGGKHAVPIPAAETSAAGKQAAGKPAAGKPAEEAVNPLPDMAIGSAEAPVTVIEYSSLSCPHCAAFHKEVLPALISDYIDTGKMRYVVREFPLNDAALAGSVVARCLPRTVTSLLSTYCSQSKATGPSKRMH